MTKKVEFSSFPPDQLDELRDIFSRFELILRALHDFQGGLYNLEYDHVVPFVSVLELFSDSWHRNCMQFDRFFSVFGLFFRGY